MKCEGCGVERKSLHKHRKVPGFKGGTYAPENVEHLCANCHEDRHREPGMEPWRTGHTPEAQAKRSATLKRRWAAGEMGGRSRGEKIAAKMKGNKNGVGNRGPAGRVVSRAERRRRAAAVRAAYAAWTPEQRAEHAAKISAAKRKPR